MVTTGGNRLEPLAAARELAPWVRSVADDIDLHRELPQDLAQAMADAGLFRSLVPHSFNGYELDLPTYIQVVEEIAKADGSTGWCLNQGSVLATHSAFLHEDVANLIWGNDPRGVLANGPSPSAQAVVVEGGYRVTGKWAFSSGCTHATWLAGLGAVIENGKPKHLPNDTPEVRYMLMPKSEAEFIDAWHVKGLRGTGSQHFTVTDHFVPAERTVWTVADPVI